MDRPGAGRAVSGATLQSEACRRRARFQEKQLTSVTTQIAFQANSHHGEYQVPVLSLTTSEPPNTMNVKPAVVAGGGGAHRGYDSSTGSLCRAQPRRPPRRC